MSPRRLASLTTWFALRRTTLHVNKQALYNLFRDMQHSVISETIHRKFQNMNTTASVAGFDFKSLSEAELKKLRAKIDAHLESVQSVQREEATKKVQALVKEYDLQPEELFHFSKQRKKANGSTGKVAAKYRDPDTGKEWTGRGKAPTWIADKDRNQFLINPTS